MRAHITGKAGCGSCSVAKAAVRAAEAIALTGRQVVGAQTTRIAADGAKATLMVSGHTGRTAQTGDKDVTTQHSERQ